MSALDPRTFWAVAVLVIASVIVSVAPAVAQQSESQGTGMPYPRPHVVAEGDVVVRPNNLAIKYYVSVSNQSGAVAKAGDGDEAQYYVLYEPPIFLRTVSANGGAERTLDARISEDGTVSLPFHWDTDVEETRAAIRGAISGTAYADAEISPFFVEDSWFESALDPEVRSGGFPRQSFTATGTVWAYFRFGSRDAADKFVAGLNDLDDAGPPIQLNFRYTFSGVARDVCTAEVSGEQVRETSRFKDLEGAGSATHVTREQAAEIVDDVFRSVSVRATCRDVGAADRLVKRAMERLGSPDAVSAATWENFDEFTRLNPQDFAANVSRSLEESNKTVDRTQWRSADVEVDNIAASLKTGGSVVWGLASAAASISFERASQEAKSRFLDLLEKNSVSLAWTGEKFEPKSVDVYTTGRVVSAWEDGVSVGYTHITDSIGSSYAIALTEKNWLGVISVTPEEAFEIRAELDRRTQDLDTRTQALYRVSRSLEAVADDLEARVGSIDQKFSDITGSIMTHSYSFDLRATRTNNSGGIADYVTGVSAGVYMPSIASWEVNCDAGSRRSPMIKEYSPEGGIGKGKWVILFDTRSTTCFRLEMMVNYFKKPTHGSPDWRYWMQALPAGPDLVLSSGTEFFED